MQLASVDMNLLVALDVLLAEGSVTRAADRLRVGQPAMSATLARLRALFNDPLLVRQGRALVPTPLALSLEGPLRAALAELSAVVNSGQTFDPQVDRRMFSIIASDYVALLLLKPLIDALPTIAPHVQLHVQPIEGNDMERIVRGDVDIVIMPDDLADPSVEVRRAPLFTDTYICALDAEHPDVGETLTQDEFSRLPYLVLNHGSLPTLVERRLTALGVRRSVHMVAQSFIMAPYLLPHTRLVTVMQEKLARLLMPTDRFRLMPPPVDLGPIRETMTWAPSADQEPGSMWLRSQLREFAAHV